MQTRRRLLNGEAALIDAPDAAGLPGGTAISVLALDGTGEMEVNGGREADLSFFLEVTGTTLERDLALRGGRTVRYGRFGGDPQQGLAWSIVLGGHHVYGFGLPTLTLEALAGFLTDVEMQADDLGAVLTPTGRTSWSQYRTHTLAQVVELAPAAATGYLLDIRRARTGQLQTGRAESGVRVRGGLLTRSGDQEQHRYGILEGEDFISYGLPGTDEGVDAVLTSLSQLSVELIR